MYLDNNSNINDSVNSAVITIKMAPDKLLIKEVLFNSGNKLWPFKAGDNDCNGQKKPRITPIEIHVDVSKGPILTKSVKINGPNTLKNKNIATPKII